MIFQLGKLDYWRVLKVFCFLVAFFWLHPMWRNNALNSCFFSHRLLSSSVCLGALAKHIHFPCQMSPISRWLFVSRCKRLCRTNGILEMNKKTNWPRVHLPPKGSSHHQGYHIFSMESLPKPLLDDCILVNGYIPSDTHPTERKLSANQVSLRFGFFACRFFYKASMAIQQKI